MRRDVRMDRSRVVIVVTGIDVGVQERRAHGATLDGESQTECEGPTEHAAILSQNQILEPKSHNRLHEPRLMARRAVAEAEAQFPAIAHVDVRAGEEQMMGVEFGSEMAGRRRS
jgi:hypothetical protein